MAKIKVFLGPGEHPDLIKDELLKALKKKTHKKRQFQDPLLEEIYKQLNLEFQQLNTQILKEIQTIVQMDDDLLKYKK